MLDRIHGVNFVVSLPPLRFTVLFGVTEGFPLMLHNYIGFSCL